MSLKIPFNGTVTLMFGIGLVVGFIVALETKSPYLMIPPQRAPLPHQIPKYKGGVSLRFAMVADVLHERFPMHGPDYYLHRNAEVQAALAKLNPPSSESNSLSDPYWGLLDDLAVGYVHLGDYPQAVKIMLDKLKQQEERNISGMPLYSTYANLGTAMMIEAITKMLGSGDLAASIELNQSLGWVRRSIEVNPEAHFGREVWQVKLGEHLVDAAHHPNQLLEKDMVGFDLSKTAAIYQAAEPRAMQLPSRWAAKVGDAVKTDGVSEFDRQELRSMIWSVGASGRTPIGFDEPTLAIIGMWRYGAGANAHFSLTLGETMLFVGQRYIAWDAFERAIRLADGFWPDPEMKRQFIEHCRSRQAEIEAALTGIIAQELRAAFDAELKRGQDYQREYQQFESERLARGVRTDDPHFYDQFNATHAKIASDPGRSDEISFFPSGSRILIGLPGAVLFAGLFALLSACVIRRQRELAI